MAAHFTDLAGIGEVLRHVKEFVLAWKEGKQDAVAKVLKNQEQALNNVDLLLTLATKYDCKPEVLAALIDELWPHDTKHRLKQILRLPKKSPRKPTSGKDARRLLR